MAICRIRLKFLMLLFALVGLFINHSSYAYDISSIKTIQTQKYNPNLESNRIDFSTGIGLMFFGNLFKPNKEQLQNDIYKQLSTKELDEYFSKRERAILADQISSNILNRYLAKGMTNQNISGGIHYAVTDLLTRVITRILEKEGISSSKRREAWARHILAPFHSCAQKAITYKETQKCQESIQVNLVQNIGLALTNELAAQELGEKYVKGQSSDYQQCLSPQKRNADNRVKGCVTKTMQSAVYDFGIDKLAETAEKELPGSSKKVKNAVSSPFRNCLKNAPTKASIEKCGDILSIIGGATIAEESVLSAKEIKENYSTSKERKSIASVAYQTFKSCAEENGRKNRREDGVIRTDNCAKETKNKVTAEVVSKIFEKNIDKNTNGSQKEKQALHKEEVLFFKKCWSNSGSEKENNKCLRNSVIHLTGGITDLRLREEIPEKLQKRDPSNVKKLLSSMNQCIENSLPNDILKDNSLVERKIDLCARELARTAALDVAEYELSEAVKGKIENKNDLKLLQNNLVNKDFADCLGKLPDEKKIKSCSENLKLGAAMEVSKYIFTEKYTEISNAKTTPFIFKPEEKAKFLINLEKKQMACLISKQPVNTDERIENCLKNSIEELALHLGDILFKQSVNSKVPKSTKEMDLLVEDFHSEFSSCLKEKKNANLDKYVNNIESCQERMTALFTKKIGHSEIVSQLDKNISNKDYLAKREDLKQELTNSFDKCIADIPSNKELEREQCIEKVKDTAIKNITLIKVREAIQETINAKEMPKAFQALEKQYLDCSKDAQKIKKCAKEYALNASEKLASLKVRRTLEDALGAVEYPKASDDINKMESYFHSCLEQASSLAIDNERFINVIQECGKNLEKKVVKFLQKKSTDWIVVDGEKEKQFAIPVALAIPCFDNLFPIPPYTDEIRAIDPEGVLQFLTKLIGGYIDYDLDRAKGDIDTVLSQIIEDLKAAGPKKARENLLKLIIKNGMMDQVLKVMIREEVKIALNGIADPEMQLPDELKKKLLDPNTFEKIITPEVMNKLRPLLADRLIKPILLDGKSLHAPEQEAALNLLKQEVAETLLGSDDFGKLILDDRVNHGLNNLRWYESVVVSLFGTRDWNEMRKTEKGKAAETYIKESVLRPIFLKQNLSKEELDSRMKKTKDLISDAMF